MKKKILALMLAAAMLLLPACAQEIPSETTAPSNTETPVVTDILTRLGLTPQSKEATSHTASVNSAVLSQLDFSNTQEAEFAVRGLIDAPEVLELKDANGNVIWSQAAYGFLTDNAQAPSSVNPSLWENTKNNHAYGLFEVVEGIYQVRGYDMANLTVIAGDTGWILFDPLMSVECAQAAMDLIEKNLGQRPIKAVIISHCHVDHYGGIKGVLSPDEAADSRLPIDQQLASGKIPIIVPQGFAEHAVSENLYAGNAMARRANYQYGVFLNPGVTGKLSVGIGMGQSVGTISYMAPTYEITTTGQSLTIDGVELEFQLTPGTEAPAEMNTWLPQFKALWMAENCTGTLHNLYTLRGAQVRDGADWAKYITEAITRYGQEAQVTFQSHNWPHWGNDVVNEYMVNTAAVYQFINDQTLAYINQGYTANEIANMIQLPEALAKNWYTRQYYGTLSHNSKAVYQKYMGWYDANPVHLNPLAPTESAKKWVEYLGDVDKVLEKAKEDFDRGEYQWVAEITSVLVYADPDNTAARYLCADALEQLGYQSESGAWRNAYLSAALELRKGNQFGTTLAGTYDGSLRKEMTPSMIFGYMGILLNKKAMAQEEFTIQIHLIDLQEHHLLQVKNGVLLVYENTQRDDADVTLTCPKNGLLYLLAHNVDALGQISRIEGDSTLLQLFSDNLSQGNVPNFNLIEP